VLDFEPMSSPPTHAVSPTLPVALALAEALQANGREIVAACAKGFEMQGRVLLASSHDRGALPFHTPGVVGVMGAAVAASHLLELDPARLCHALGMAIKFYPSKYPTHFGIAAALGLRDRIGDPRDIARVSIDSPDIADADRPRPRSGLEGKFSFQYTVAAALLDGGVGMESFTDDRRFREDMARLLERIELVRDPGRSRDTRNMSVAVSVILRDGSTHRNVCSRPPGSWGEPIDVESHRAKVSSCLRVRLSAADAERLMDLLARLEALSGPEALQLPALLS
jgi:aconitate decarboxylase